MAALLAPILIGLATAAKPMIAQAAKNYTIKYGPEVSRKGVDATDRYTRDAHAARDFVREKAADEYEVVTEEEWRDVVGDSDKKWGEEEEEEEENLIEFSDEEDEKKGEVTRRNDIGRERRVEDRGKPKTIRLFVQTIRMSRNGGVLGTEVFGSPFPFLAHWGVEVDGITYELRDPRNGSRRAGARSHDDGRVVLYEEMGQADRKIKLQVIANRRLPDSTRFFEVGSTILKQDQIIKIASLVFRRFGQGYDIMLDNCQLFCQLLAQTISGKENAEQIRIVLKKKSILKLPVALSYVAAPAYHLMATLHHALPRSSPNEYRNEFFEHADRILEQFEKFFYHPQLYAARNGSRRRLLKSA